MHSFLFTLTWVLWAKCKSIVEIQSCNCFFFSLWSGMTDGIYLWLTPRLRLYKIMTEWWKMNQTHGDLTSVSWDRTYLFVCLFISCSVGEWNDPDHSRGPRRCSRASCEGLVKLSEPSVIVILWYQTFGAGGVYLLVGLLLSIHGFWAILPSNYIFSHCERIFSKIFSKIKMEIHDKLLLGFRLVLLMMRWIV